jgi:predicted ArsR family transcriptional regulator
MALVDVRPGEGTRGRILEELAVAPRTAKDVARKIGIQESAARGHLERLATRGFVRPTFSREGVGRPRKRYLLTPAGYELFPRRYELLLDSVIDELLAREGQDYVAKLFAESARRMVQQVALELPPGAPVEERARRLVNVLNELGFRSSVEQDKNGTLKIVRNNCVFRHSAFGHSYLLCDVFDKHLTEALLGRTGLDLKDSITRGGMRCTHLIQLR